MKKHVVLAVMAWLLSANIACAQAANGGDVVISEVAWMGTKASGNNEWMELQNTTSRDINLAGWTLKTADEKIKISLKGTIDANGFYLLERTDDDSVPGILADTIYKGALSNIGQYLKLYDGAGNLIDQADFATKWPGGNSTTKQTMERIGNTWQTSKDPGGTPKAKNSSGAIVVESPKSQTANSKEVQNSNTETKNNITYPKGIVISEILPSPEGADGENEFIEVYNGSTVSVDISGWKLADAEGSVANYAFLSGTTMAADGYLAVKRPETNITLNNDKDSVSLMTPDGAVVDTISYQNAPKGQSYNKTTSGWTWSSKETPGTTNVIAAAAAATSAPLPKVKKSGTKMSVATAAISQPIALDSQIFSNNLDKEESGGNPALIFIAALAAAIIGGAIAVMIKIRNSRSNNLETQ